MEESDRDLAQRLLQALRQRGPLRAGQIQTLLARSQPTVSRLVGSLASQVLVLGAARATRYAAPLPILGLNAQQPLAWVHEDGRREAFGTVSLTAGERIHLRADGIDDSRAGQLPWLLSPLRGEGFLGRALARRLALHGLPDSPERWSLTQQLFAALHTPDSPGALVLGDAPPTELPLLDGQHDALAEAVARSLPAGSSAGGEQAKFLARRADGQPVLVKFTPPRPSPFGDLWHDLLHAEALALALLGEAGVPVAQARVFSTERRTYFESTRFDRIGSRGRRHTVPLWAVHEAFVPGSPRHWEATAQVLARQRRVPQELPLQLRALCQFGRLIGNNDMHFGNLSLWVAREDAARGRFTLAPLYDMLPMRWRPSVHAGDLGMQPFDPDPDDLHGPARPLALAFWQRLEAHPAIGRDFRVLAAEMARRVSGATVMAMP